MLKCVNLRKIVEIVKLCMILLNQGILTKETHDNVIRFAPPLIISQANLDWSLEKISQVIKKF